MPGAGIFKPEWVPWLSGRMVQAFLDHDDPGRQGTLCSLDDFAAA